MDQQNAKLQTSNKQDVRLERLKNPKFSYSSDTISGHGASNYKIEVFISFDYFTDGFLAWCLSP